MRDCGYLASWMESVEGRGRSGGGGSGALRGSGSRTIGSFLLRSLLRGALRIKPLLRGLLRGALLRIMLNGLEQIRALESPRACQPVKCRRHATCESTDIS